MKGRKPDERKADPSVVLMMKMKMTKDGADRDRALCVSSIEANVQSLTVSVCLSVSIQLITFPQATSGSKLRSDVTGMCVCVCAHKCMWTGVQSGSLGHFIVRKHAQKPHKKKETRRCIELIVPGGDSGS